MSTPAPPPPAVQQNGGTGPFAGPVYLIYAHYGPGVREIEQIKVCHPFATQAIVTKVTAESQEC